MNPLRLPGALLALLSCAPLAAAPVVLKVDLKPLIRAAASSEVQFAVPVPHRASTSKDGQWLGVGGHQEWHYSVRVPTAVSLSFHATRIQLPPGATLTVQSAVTRIVYRSADIRSPELWSRVQPGDSLQFTLVTPAADRDKVVLEIQSLQAGYRTLGPQAADHPYFRQLIRAAAAASGQSSAAGTAACARNYECGVTPGNAAVAQATVGIVVANLYQCTGTLINDVPGDNTPYLLTARHCESGIFGGTAPANAASMTVYWDAVSACNTTLGSIYDPGVATQTGASTLVEQQDAWLVKLDENPLVKDAQFAGFDASGAAVQGGYTVHHALGFDKQLTGWFGRARAAQQSGVLGVTYVSNFLETVNALGNIGPGASGGALVDANNRVVGSLSLGHQTSDPSGFESCPLASPPAPNGSNTAASFTSLAAVWKSRSDATSSTGTATLKSVLDPAGSGTKVVSATHAVNLNFTASTHSLQEGEALLLRWDAPGALQCTATGGVSGDGWTGTLPASGSVTVNEAIDGPIRYQLTCRLSSNRTIVSGLTVNWYGSGPSVTLDAVGTRWTGAPATLTWNSNLAPCSLAGGTLALANLPSSGTATATETLAGDVLYTITCGSGATAMATTTVSYMTPTLAFRPNGTDRLLGQPVYLYWDSDADTCVPSGGSPGDGWSTNAFRGRGTTALNAPVGTWNYTLACTSGASTVTRNVTVSVATNAPYVSASVTPDSVIYLDSPADYVTLSYKSNLTMCTVSSDPVTLQLPTSPNPQPLSNESYAEDIETFAPGQPGIYTLTVTCTSDVGTAGATATSSPVTFTAAHPPAPTIALAVAPATVHRGDPFTVTWSTVNARSCTDFGTAPGVGASWGLGVPQPLSGSQQLTTNATGTATLGLDCQSIDLSQTPVSARTTITVLDAIPPTVALTATTAQLTIGDSFTLNWTSTLATACTASGGGADGSGSTWSGTVSTSGTLTETASAVGSYQYSLSCSSAVATTQVRQTVTVRAAPGHGGGALGLAELALLAALVGVTRGRGIDRPHSRLPDRRR